MGIKSQKKDQTILEVTLKQNKPLRAKICVVNGQNQTEAGYGWLCRACDSDFNTIKQNHDTV